LSKLSPEFPFTGALERLIISASAFARDIEMEEINVTQAARNLTALVNRVARQGASFELTRGGRPIARLVPSNPSKEVKVLELSALFARLPRLDPDDIDAFEQDIGESECAVGADRDPWT